MYVDIMDLHANGGLMAAVPYGTTYLTDGPDGDGLDFWSSSEFTNTGAVGRNDWNNNLFFGLFNAPVTGDYEFRVAFYDDRSGLWIDLDQDGVFESSVPGLGSNRGEQLSWDDIETKTVRLDAGSYMFAVTHGQGTGGSRVSVLFKTPAMTTGQAVIKPSDPAQDGLWTAIPEPVTLTILALGGLAILRRRRSC